MRYEPANGRCNDFLNGIEEVADCGEVGEGGGAHAGFLAHKQTGQGCQETRTPVIFFPYFLTYGCSLLSIPCYVPPPHIT